MCKIRKILFLADVNSIHTRRWANSLCENNYQIKIFSLTKPTNSTLKYLCDSVYVTSADFNKNITNKSDGNISKFRYLKIVPKLKKIIKEYQPDILHAHYASSYGLIGKLSGFKPFALSLWGSDIYSFPKRTILHSQIFKSILNKADIIFSTSDNMKIEAEKYTNNHISLTPFGVDIEKFTVRNKNNKNLTIGTIKSLNQIYGIDRLIEAFALIQQRNQEKKLHLLIVGDGAEKERYINLAKEKLQDESYTFAGHINHNDIVKYYHKIDIFIALSRTESFGVSVLEACSCGIPVVVSDAFGFQEIVKDGETGFIVPDGKPIRVAEIVEKLISDNNYYSTISDNARKFVINNYMWSKCVDKMIEGYNQILIKA